MNGGWLPILGGQLVTRKLQNARVKKSFAPPSFVAPRRLARSRSAGFTLIEVMIALIVLVLGVLGAAGMTLASMRDSKQSGLRSQASSYAYELGDLMRANPPQYSRVLPPVVPVLLVDAEAVFTGTVPAAVSTCWNSSGCSPLQMAQNDFATWNAKVTGAGGLPNAAFKICHDAANMAANAAGFTTCDNLATSPLVVKMRWDEKLNNARGQAATGAVTPQYLMVVIRPY
jgi:type IV pilus assembly protein PilV